MNTKIPFRIVCGCIYMIMLGCSQSAKSSEAVVDTAKVDVMPTVDNYNEEGKTMLFSDDRYKWYYKSSPAGISKELYVYDTVNATLDSLSLNKTRSNTRDVEIREIVENNGRISVIIENKLLGKNAVDKTDVWTFDCSSREWHPVAQNISGAEFTDNGKSVKLKQIEFRIIDWETPDKKKSITTSLTVPLDFPSSNFSSSDVDRIDFAYEKVAFPRNSSQLDKFFTTKGLQQLRDEYEYDCEDGDCYGVWGLTTGAQESVYENCPPDRVVGINPDKKGGYTVIYFESGYFGATHLKVKNGKIDYYETVLSPFEE